MTTLAALADRCQNALSDAGGATWSQAIVEEWVIEAIRDYSNHFPRTKTASISCVTNDRAYNLPADFIAALSIEYPTGEDPPTYLERRPYAAEFWDLEGFYDIIYRDDASSQPELWISEEPTTGETIAVEYQAIHDITIASSGTITVPAQHEPLLVAYVIWKAWTEQLAEETRSPTSGSSLLLSQLNENARTAWNTYADHIEHAQRAAGRSALIHWKMDQHDRVY